MAKQQDEIVTIEILNWNKHQHKNGSKTYDWFKFYHNALYDPKISSLNASEFRVFITILCLASQRRSRVVQTSYRDLARFSKVRTEFSRDCTSTLEQLHIVSVFLGTQRREEKRREENIMARSNEQPSLFVDILKEEQPVAKREYDLEKLYSIYPSRPNMKKKLGMERLAKIVKSKNDFEKMELAINNYKAYIDSEKKNQKFKNNFVKQFPTFISEWEEWLDVTKHKQEKIKFNEVFS